MPRTKKPRVKVPSEALECARLVDYLRAKGLKFSHVPNSTNSRAQGIKNKRMGTSAGVPDYLILLPEKGVLWLEMKRQKGGRLSVEQSEWLFELGKLPGQACRVAYGFDQAKLFIEELLG